MVVENEHEMLLYYDFSTAENGLIPDRSGNGNDGLIYGEGAEVKDHVLTLPGGEYESDAAYVQLPTGMFDDQETLTISLWLKNETGRGNYSAMYFGSEGQWPKNYWLLNPCNFGGKFKSVITNDCNGSEHGVEGVAGHTVEGPDSDDQWHLYTTVITGDSITAYYDEAKFGPVSAEGVVSSFEKGMVAYIGRSSWHDIFYKGGVKDVRVFDRAFTEEDVQDLYEKSDLYADADTLELPGTALSDLELPVAGDRGSSIEWESSNEAAIDSTGKLGTYEETTTVTLTKNGEFEQRSFSVNYIGGGEEGRLRERINRFDLGISYITEDIVLPQSYDGIQVEWTGNEYISASGKVTRPDADAKVTLKAVFTSGNVSVTKEYEVTVAAKATAYLATYVASYEYNMGVEFAQFPSNQYTDNKRTDVLYYAVSEDGQSYTGLNHDKAVMYPKSFLQLGSPSLFRKPDGTYGLIASHNNDSDEIIVCDSSDLINFENQRVAKLKGGKIVKNPTAVYDNGTCSYQVFWEDENGQGYVASTKDFTKFEAAERTDYKKTAVEGSIPEYAKAEEASVFALTTEEYERVTKKFGEIYSVSVSGAEDRTAASGEPMSLPGQVTVHYNDGSTADMNVEWDTKGAGIDLDNPKEGTYQISGTVKNEDYNSPLALYRADPFVAYNEQDGMYYLTGSNLNKQSAAGGGAYASLVIRKASTINGLTDAEEYEIFTTLKNENLWIDGWYWAPELHYIGGKWRIIVMSGRTDVGGVEYGWRQSIFTCYGDDLTDAKNWKWEGYIKAGTNGELPGAFDTTYFEYGGQCYYVTPTKSSIYITTVDTDDLTTPTGPLVQIATSDRSYESNIGSVQNIEEASSVLIHDGRIFIVYAGSTVDMHYCVCMLYADVDSDLMDPASWKKYPYPLLNTADLTTTVKAPTFDKNGNLIEMGSYEGVFGPGHNSFTIDESGNPVIIYHAREWGDSYDTDTVFFGNQAFEGKEFRNADLVGSILDASNSSIGNTRYAKAGESFSYDMVVNTDMENRYQYVICQFVHGDNGKSIKVTVEGEEAGAATLDHAIWDTGLSSDFKYKRSFKIPNKALEKARTLTINGETRQVVRVTFESGKAGEDSARLVNSAAITSTVFEGAVGDEKYGLVDPGRHAYANSVHYGADGFPICNMTADQILAPELKQITMTVRVSQGNTEPSENPDQRAAKAVIDAINAIGTAEYTDASKAKIEAARKAYDTLSAEQKKLVANYGKLTAAETRYAQLKEEAEKKGTNPVPVKKGQVYKVGNYKYRVTNARMDGKGTVTLTGVTRKSLKKIKAANTVKLQGKSFQVTQIGKSAFKGCKKATSAVIGKNVKVIGSKAFYQCSKLKKITIKGTAVKKVGKNVLKGINGRAKIKVPAKKLKAYKKLLNKKGQKKSVKIMK